MSARNRLFVAHPTPRSSNDLILLRSCVPDIEESETREAVLAFIEGLESEGVVVGKMDSLLTPQQAANFLGVSRQYVDKLIADGRIAAGFKVASRHRVIKMSDLVELEKKHQTETARIGAAIYEFIDAGAEY